MRIYKKCPCCNKTMFLMLGSDFGNEIEFGSAFGSKDNIPHTDTNHEEDWSCLTRFLDCLNESHGDIFISLNDKEKGKIPKDYQEDVLSWTEGGFKKEETTEPPKEKPKTDYSTPTDSPKTIQGWYDAKKITYQDYKLLTTPWTEEREGDLYVYEVALDTETLYTWKEITDYLRRAKLSQQREREEKRREEELKRKMNDGKDWGDINLEFKGEWGEDYKRRWVSCNFTYSQVKEWIDIGIEPAGEQGDNAFFCAWLRDKKGMTPQQVLNSGNLRRLREEYNSTLIYDG